MRQMTQWMVIALTAAMTLTACGNGKGSANSKEAEEAIAEVYKARNYDRLLTLADSFENNGSLSQAKGYYWLGYASDRLKHQRMAEFYWKISMDAADNEGDMDTYAQSASRLANLLCVRGDYKTALKNAAPAVRRIEEAQCDTTSDYINLLIYVGCCAAATGQGGENANDGFDKAYQKHLDNIAKNHSDAAYKNAIAGLINIAYYCNHSQNYQDALKWTGHFGELLNEYQQRPAANTEYVDKQLARFDIYQAIALEGLGRKEEAAQVYDSFLTTAFSQTPEGRINANDYLLAADRWGEAADNYRSLDAMLAKQEAPYSIDNIRDLVLKKYRANLTAGRRDTAVAVSMQICDSLENAFTRAKAVDALEQATIVKNVEKITEQQAESSRLHQQILYAAIALLFLLFIIYALYRRTAERKNKEAYKQLQQELEQVETKATEKERTATETRIARQLQQGDSSEELPQHKRIDSWLFHTPGEMPGSSFHKVTLQDEHLLIALGNADSNDVKGTISTAIAKAQMETAAALKSDPARIIGAVSESSVKLFVGLLNLETGLLRYASNDSHVPLVVNQEISQLTADGSLQETTLTPGTTLFLFNDGVLEARNGEKKAYGEKKLMGAALQAMRLDPAPKPFVTSIQEAVGKFTGGTAQKRDLTMLAIRYQ